MSYFEWVQDLQGFFWDEDQVNTQLERIIKRAFNEVNNIAAREKVVADLAAAGLLDKVEDHTLMVPHHDRSGIVIEPWCTALLHE